MSEIKFYFNKLLCRLFCAMDHLEEGYRNLILAFMCAGNVIYENYDVHPPCLQSHIFQSHVQ